MHQPHHTVRKQWGRHASTLALFLFVGFLVNLAVAWGSIGAVRAGWPNTKSRVQIGNAVAHSRYIFVYRADSLLFSQITVQSHFMATPADLDEVRRGFTRNGQIIVDAHTIIPRWTRWTLEGVVPDSTPISLPPRATALTRGRIPDTLVPTVVWRRFNATGLPFRSILSRNTDPRVILPSSVWVSQFAEVTNPGTLVVNFWPSSVTIGGKGYPLNPLWIGTLLNTAIYAALLFILSRIPVALRRRRRRSRNQCIRCAYSLVGLTSTACPECGHPRPNN